MLLFLLRLQLNCHFQILVLLCIEHDFLLFLHILQPYFQMEAFPEHSYTLYLLLSFFHLRFLLLVDNLLNDSGYIGIYLQQYHILQFANLMVLHCLLLLFLLLAMFQSLPLQMQDHIFLNNLMGYNLQMYLLQSLFH